MLTHGLGGAALPIAGARQRIGTDGAVGDMREKRGGGLRIVQEAQRDPAGGEIMIDAEITAHRLGGVARDVKGGARITVVEQLAHQDAPFLPPLVEIDHRGRVLRHGEDQLAGFFQLVVFAQPLHAREDIAGIAPRARRHGVEQRLGVVQPLDHRRAGPPDRQIVAAEAVGCAHAGLDIVGIEALVHAHLVVGAREHGAEHL